LATAFHSGQQWQLVYRSGPIPHQGTKTAQNEVEENHCLMAVNMVEQTLSGTGKSWTEASLKAFLEKLNDKLGPNSSGRVTHKKQKSCINMVIHTSPKVLEEFKKHYIKYTWERSCLNEALLGDKIWRLDYKFKEAKGDWAKVYVVSEAILVLLQTRLFKDWETKFPKHNIKAFTVPELQQARPSRFVPDDPDMAEMTVAQQYCLFMCLYVNWVRPKAEESYGIAGADLLDKALHEWNPWLLHDLRYAVLKREQSATYDVLRLSDLQGIDAALKQTAPGVSIETQVSQSRTLEEEWNKFETKYKEDLDLFTS
jgi:hypothetical protein